MPDDDVRVMLGRRPPRGASAFGHVDLSEAARAELAEIVRAGESKIAGKTEIDFHPEDRAEEGEVLRGELGGFDSHYQPNAPWSLERAVAAIRESGIPETLAAGEIEEGGWSFYALRLQEGGTDTVVIRSRGPRRGLRPTGRVLTRLVGTELRPVEEPLLSFDFGADVLVVGEQVYILRPDVAERLFVDAEEVKRRAPQTAERYTKEIGVALSTETSEAIERVCSHNAFTARRAERLIAEGDLGTVTAARVRASLPEAGRRKDWFGNGRTLVAGTDERAKVLIEITADLYYQPRFAKPSRRVGSWRNVR